MNFFQLECFVLAVEKSSFAEVAAAMHVTQPTITYQITNLEEELEEKLFLRTNRGVEVTRAGQLFYQDAGTILAQYHQALNHFRHAVSLPDSVVRVGFTRPPDHYDFFAAIHRFRAKYPDTVVDVLQDEIVTERTAHLAERFDVLIHYRYNKEDFAQYDFIPLGRCPYYVMVSQYSPLAEKEALTLAELRGYKQLVVDEYKNTLFQVPSMKELKKAGVEVVTYSNMDQLMYAIADGVGYGVYPAKYQEVKAGFKRVPFLSEEPLEYGLLCHREHSAEVEEFIRYMVSELREE